MATRLRVLASFKEIHRTCQQVFAGDRQALKASRLKINTDFKKYKPETNPAIIEKHIQLAQDAARLLRLTVVQAKLKEDGSAYEVRLNKDTYLEDNVPFRDYQEDFRPSRRTPRKQFGRNVNFSDYDDEEAYQPFRQMPRNRSSRDGDFDDEDTRPFRQMPRNRSSRDAEFDDEGAGPFRRQMPRKQFRSDSDYEEDSPFGQTSRKRSSRFIDSSEIDSNLLKGKKS